MKPELLAYLAAAIDCDGSINVMRNKRLRADGTLAQRLMVRVALVQVNPDLPELFRETFGGNLYYYSAPYRERTRGWHQWYVGGANAAKVLRTLRPYLRLKGRQADLTLQLWAMLDEQRRLRNGQRLTAEQNAERLQLADAIRALNQRRKHASTRGRQPETPSYSTDDPADLPASQETVQLPV